MSELLIDAYAEFNSKWALVAAGTPAHHNAMTISWGGVGCLWGKRVVTVYIRPDRYTWKFMEENDCFTVSFYPDEYRKSLEIMGSRSGRNCNKDAEAGLSPVPCGESVTYREARRTLRCRKLFAQDMDGNNFFPESIRTFYSREPVHKLYIGEVLEIID